MRLQRRAMHSGWDDIHKPHYSGEWFRYWYFFDSPVSLSHLCLLEFVSNQISTSHPYFSRHTFSVASGFKYVNGCAGVGADCKSANCVDIFHNPANERAVVTYQSDNVRVSLAQSISSLAESVVLTRLHIGRTHYQFLRINPSTLIDSCKALSVILIKNCGIASGVWFFCFPGSPYAATEYKVSVSGYL